MNCEMCSEIYDKNERRPMTLIPCGHTLCSACLDLLKSTDVFVCTQCNETVIEHKPSYAVLKILEQNLLVDFKNIKMRQSVQQLVNQVNDLKTSILLITEKKLQDNQYRINALKNDVSNQTTDLMNMLLNNEEKTVSEATDFHARLVTRLRRDPPEDDKFISDVEIRDLNNMDRSELTGIKMKLNTMRSNLVFKSNILNEIDLSLESNNVPFNYDIGSIGEIVQKQISLSNHDQAPFPPSATPSSITSSPSLSPSLTTPDVNMNTILPAGIQSQLNEIQETLQSLEIKPNQSEIKPLPQIEVKAACLTRNVTGEQPIPTEASSIPSAPFVVVHDLQQIASILISVNENI